MEALIEISKKVISFPNMSFFLEKIDNESCVCVAVCKHDNVHIYALTFWIWNEVGMRTSLDLNMQKTGVESKSSNSDIFW